MWVFVITIEGADNQIPLTVICRITEKIFTDVSTYKNTRILTKIKISLIGKVTVYCAGGSGLIPSWTNTQGLKIIREKVLPLL